MTPFGLTSCDPDAGFPPKLKLKLCDVALGWVEVLRDAKGLLDGACEPPKLKSNELFGMSKLALGPPVPASFVLLLPNGGNDALAEVPFV